MDNTPNWLKNKLAYDKKYAKEHLKQFGFALNRKTDSDVIEKLESVPNKCDYIKSLIREDMKKQGI